MNSGYCTYETYVKCLQVQKKNNYILFAELIDSSFTLPYREFESALLQPYCNQVLLSLCKESTSFTRVENHYLRNDLTSQLSSALQHFLINKSI